jgi:RNA polymerase sigma-32 factor
MDRGGNMHVKSENHFDLRRCVPMSREEEHRCALEYVRTKDPVLAQRLVLANMRMVVALAHRYCRAARDLGDFVQEGNRGLLKAVDKYDPTRGIKFCTYAVWWIRAYMLSFTMKNWRLVTVGTTQVQRKLFFSLRKERDRLERTGAEADTRELASRLQVKETEIVGMMERFAGGEMSLDLPARSKEAEGPTIGDLLSDTSAPGPDQRVEDAEFTQVLRSKLEAFGATLRGRDAQIFGQRLLSDEPLTLVQLAAQFGVTRERTRQLEQRLKIRIRAYLQNELGDAFEVPVSVAGRRRGLAATEEMVETGMFEGTSYPMWVPEVAPSQVSS